MYRSQAMRYKLIPAQGRHPSCFFEGTEKGAIWEAEDLWADYGCQVLVVTHPPGDIVRPLALVGKPPPPTKRKQ